MFYELVCGYFPFENELVDDPIQIYTNIIEKELVFPKLLKNENLTDLLSKLICKNPEKRISNIQTIFNHPYYEDFDFEQLLEMKLNAPYIPKIKPNIKLNTQTFEDFLNKNLKNFKYVPLDEEKM